jgi:hypothetical protein
MGEADMRLYLFNYLLWWLTPVLMAVIAVAMYRRKLHRDFPYFFNYVLFQILSFAIEFPLRNWVNWYYISWTLTALSVVVSFAVLLEIFKDAFRPYEALRDLSVILIRWCLLVVLLVTGMWAVTSWHGNDPDSITSAILLVSRCVRMMQCGMVLFMLLFSEYLGISRRNLVFGVSIGFGFYAAVNMLLMTAASHHTILGGRTINTINSLAYVTAMLIWLAYTVLPSTVRRSAQEAQMSSQKWDEVLDELRNTPTGVSLLDTMDQTVERLLYHRRTEAGAAVSNRR